jgi:predicted transcriptional regulator
MLGWTITHQKLRELREEARLTPDVVAELVGCHRHTWYNLERGAQQPSAQLTWRIVDTFSQQLGRTITVADVATRRETRRRKPADKAEGSAA